MSAYCCVTTGILKNDLTGDTGTDAGACRARPGDTWVTIYVLNQSSKETFEFYLEPQILSNIRTLIARTTGCPKKNALLCSKAPRGLKN